MIAPEFEAADREGPLGRLVAEIEDMPSLASRGVMSSAPLRRYLSHHREHVFRGAVA